MIIANQTQVIFRYCRKYVLWLTRYSQIVSQTLTQIQSINKIVSSAQIICAPVNYLYFIMETHNMEEQLTINTRYKTSHNNFIINVFCVNNTCTNCNINSFMDIGIVW